MRGIIRGAASSGLLAAVLAAGCSAGQPASYRATENTCYAFGVQALERHITVTTVPRACVGLSHQQVNLAVARAIREAEGSRPKAAARRKAQQESGYLADLARTVPPPRPAPLDGAPARPSAALPATAWPLSLSALAAWILTAAAGIYLLAGWLADRGPRRGGSRAAAMPPVIIVSHLGFAVAGLATWIAFVATDVAVLAWIAVGIILVVAGLGMATLVTALPEPAAAARGTRAGMPVIVITIHGVLATTAILLVLLAAIGAA
jgi:hypothetical protein